MDDDSDDTVSESSSDGELIDPFELAGGVKAVLTKLPIFRLCGRDLIDKVVDQAQRIKLAEGKALELQDGGPLYVVDSGALVVTLGAGPPIVFGPGSVFNMVGMLRLAHEAEPFRPKKSSKSQAKKVTKNYAYEIFGPHFNQGKSPPLLWTDKRRKGDTKSEPGKSTINDVLCFYNLCPSASAPGAAAVLDSNPGWLPLEIVGAPAEVVPTLGGDINFFRKGGASLVALPLVLLEQVGCAFGLQTAEAVNLRISLGTFKMNCARLADMWRTIMSRCSHVFPGVPPEVIWALAEMSERREIEAGEVFVVEGTNGVEGESLILIDEGEAQVEKMLGAVGKPQTAFIGRLGPGAIIGDLCLVGGGIPRAASVRAKSSVEIIEMPVKGLLALIREYPGIMQGLAAHAREVGSFMQLRLPPRLDAVTAQEVFQTCKHEFNIEVSSHSEWTVFVGGQPIVAPGAKEAGTLYILEYGSCALELEGQGQVELMPAGCSFGDCRPLGVVVPANATIRVLTPLAIVLAVRDSVLQEARTRHYAKERPPFERRPVTPSVMGLRNLDHIMANVDMFCQCEHGFIRDLCKVVQTRGYMPGQTLFVEGAKDLEQQMFVVRGGLTYHERGGQRLEMPSKSAFGDLAMLGALHRRSVTVRAQTFCFTIEIPRSSFQEAIVKHPEQRHQFEAYAVQAMRQRPDAASANWPFLGCAPFRFIYLLNLYAGQKLFKANDPYLATPVVRSSAVLVLQGKVAVVNEEGEEVELMTAGQCFNEQIFLGIAATTSDYIEARSACELQIVPKEMWDNIMEEFPSKVDAISSSLMTYMAEKAAHKYGVKLSSPSVLRKATLLRDVSLEFAEEMCKHLESLMIVPGFTVCVEGKEGDRMLLLLRGKAYAESSSFGHVHYGVGYIFGEAMLLNLRPTYPKTVWASNLCILQALPKSAYLEQIERYSKEKALVAPLFEEAEEHGRCHITKQVKNTVAFEQATIMFVSSICEHAEDKFFGGGEAIIHHGTKCTYGECDLFVILKGHVRVEDELGVLLYYLQEGSVFGEAGALGMEYSRSINVRACDNGIVHCARLIGEALEAALRIFPEEREFLEEVHYRRTEARAEFTKRRKVWLEETVLPALAQCPLFLGCPLQFLQELAAPLTQTTLNEGEEICIAGEPAASMLLLLDGAADLETQDGEKIGSVTAGGVIGEISVLGLFETRLATARALCELHVLEVTNSALNRALNLGCGASVRSALERLKLSRHHQVEKGLPMCTLEIGADKEDTCVRAIALQSELVRLSPGEILDTLPDTDPCGPHFSVVQKGRAILEIPCPFLEIQTVSIMPIEKGDLLVEGLAAEYTAQIRAISSCEIYRVRMNDYRTSIGTVNSSKKEWQARFAMLQMRCAKLLKDRGGAARGIISGLTAHPHDEAIHKWGQRRQKAVSNMRPPGQLELYATQGSTLSTWGGLSDLPDVHRSQSKSRLRRDLSAPELLGKRRQASRHSETLRLPMLPTSPSFSALAC